MTGFGKAEKNFQNKNIIIELRALNSKNVDLKTRIPSNYRDKEMYLRKFLANKLKRGKIDFNLSIEDLEDKPKNNINSPILEAYLNQLKTIHPKADESTLIAAILRLPDVLQAEKEDFDEAEWQVILEVLTEASNQLTKYRQDEGEALEKDLRLRLNNIQKGLENIKKLDSNRLDRIKQRLRDALEQLQQEVDANRFEQELIYYLEKLDINEEKVRLQNHLDYFEQELASDNEMKGKKLGFITQEMGREINTIGSKANDSDIQREVVQMKDALEKIKEQVLNVL
jgi:uncharacterized protein (TIGR00255 family)